MATIGACNAGERPHANDLGTAAAKTRGNVRHVADDLAKPVAVAFTGTTTFCGDDGNDESTAQYSYTGSIEPADASTIRALADRYTEDGWKRRDISGDIYLARNGYSVFIGISDRVTLIRGSSPCTPTPPRDDPLHPSNLGPGSRPER